MLKDLVRTVAPTETPVDLTEAKAHLRVDSTDEDTTIEALIEAATQRLDGYSGILGRALVTQTWVLRLPAFPCGRLLPLPLPPLQSVTSVTYYDTDDVQQTLSSSLYRVNARLGVIELKADASWPSVESRGDAVAVTFVAGYGLAAAVPQPIRNAILMIVAELYEGREGAAPNAAVKALLKPFSVPRL